MMRGRGGRVLLTCLNNSEGWQGSESRSPFDPTVPEKAGGGPVDLVRGDWGPPGFPST